MAKKSPQPQHPQPSPSSSSPSPSPATQPPAGNSVEDGSPDNRNADNAEQVLPVEAWPQDDAEGEEHEFVAALCKKVGERVIGFRITEAHEVIVVTKSGQKITLDHKELR